jgi:hypothetical protein
MKKQIVIIALAIGSCRTSDAQTWQYADPNGFSLGYVDYVPMVISSSVPYVAFRDHGNNSRGSVMKYTGLGWTSVGQEFSLDKAGFVCMKFSGSTPYVAYTDVDHFDNNLSDKVIVKRFDGTTWVNVGSSHFSQNGAVFLDFTIIGNTPYVSFNDIVTAQRNVMKYDGSNWITLASAGDVLKIATDGTDLFAATINNSNNGRLSVKKFNGISWSVVGNADFSFDWVTDLSFTFDGSVPHVAFTDQSSPQNQLSVMYLNGATWTNLGTVGISGLVFHPDLVFNNSTPYLAFQDQGINHKVRLMTYNAGVWQDVVSTGITPGMANFPSIAFDGATPFVAFKNDLGLGKATVVYLDNSTSVTEIKSLKEDIIQVYPNPTRSQLYFSTHTNVQLINVSGQMVDDKNDVNILDVSDLPAGIYFITLSDSKGQAIQRNKIVIE